MLSSRIKRHAAVSVLALAITGSATDAFAIRNRYTNEQNEGFAALFFEAFGRPAFGDEEPIGRAYRRPWHGGATPRSDGRDDGLFGY